MSIEPDPADIDELLEAVDDAISDGVSRYEERTYEQGLRDGLRWLLGQQQERPYPPEEG